MLKIIPNKKNIGAEIIVNLKDITNKDILKIKKALNKYGMLYFKEQKLTSKLYIRFAKHFGNIANYPRLKGLNKKFPQITVVQRKSTDKGPSFGEQFHTDSIYTKKPPRFTMLLSKLVPKKGKANTEFCSQYLAYKELPNSIKRKFKNIKGKYSSEGPISVTTKERVKEKGKNIKELKSSHKIIRKIGIPIFLIILCEDLSSLIFFPFSFTLSFVVTEIGPSEEYLPLIFLNFLFIEFGNSL